MKPALHFLAAALILSALSADGALGKKLSGKVLAVNQAWQFVVVDIGARQGAAVNAKMILVRDGKQIAEVRITQVEARSSVADVLKGSVVPGVNVKPGDRVVFPDN